MALISVQSLSFAYEGSYDDIFSHVSFSVDTDWKLGLIGRNGRGKTTFLRLLMGQQEYRGTISAPVTFDYFPPGVADADDDTLAVAERLVPGLQQWQLQRELGLLDVDEGVLYRPFCTLSGGEQTKVLLAALFLKQHNFLLIDEPTNHLDVAARGVVRRYLNGKKGFILVSHDRDFLDGCIDHVMSINKQDIEVVAGNFSSWWQNKENRDKMEREQDRVLKKDIDRLTTAARQTAGWSDKVEATKYGTRNSGLRPDRGHIGAKSAKMMKRAKVTERRALDAAEQKSKLLKNIESQETLKIFPLQHYAATLAALRDVSVSYGGHVVCRDVSFTVSRGERVALTGGNGSGKSSILKLILGEDIEHTGTVERASGLIISYVPQDSAFLRGSVYDYARTLDIDETQFLTILRKMDFSRIQFEKNMADFSNGQRKKVLIAGSLCQRAHLYIWDEPLNYIDVLSRIQIEQLITAFEPSMLFVEHDKAFLRNVATQTVSLDG